MLSFTQLLIGNFTNESTYSCADGDFTFEGLFPGVISLIVTIIKIGIPILLIIIGMIDLGKAVVAQKEEEIKKGQSLFIRKLISALLVFLVVFIVQFLVKFIAPKDGNTVGNCIDCFVNGKSQCSEVKPNTTGNGTADGNGGSNLQ